MGAWRRETQILISSVYLCSNQVPGDYSLRWLLGQTWDMIDMFIWEGLEMCVSSAGTSTARPRTVLVLYHESLLWGASDQIWLVNRGEVTGVQGDRLTKLTQMGAGRVKMTTSRLWSCAVHRRINSPRQRTRKVYTPNGLWLVLWESLDFYS